jgi:hypothetical protein
MRKVLWSGFMQSAPRTAMRDQEFGIAKAKLTMKPTKARPGTVGEISNWGVEVACGGRMDSGPESV